MKSKFEKHDTIVAKIWESYVHAFFGNGCKVDDCKKIPAEPSELRFILRL
jgi:hypothetical protein